MKITKIALAVAALLSSGSTLYAAPAARVLVLAGEASVTRNGQQIPLSNGAMIETGDTILVGEKSALQIRFTDNAIVSLRARTTFRVDDYRYNQDPQGDKTALSLLKGGMRTITGAIGKENPKNYSVNSAVATIGIRGTYYSLVSCMEAGDCVEPNGQEAAPGLYGGVTDGTIGVANDAGEFEFSQQEYFRVGGRNTPPVRLLSPPQLLERSFTSGNRNGESSGNTNHPPNSNLATNAPTPRGITLLSPQLPNCSGLIFPDTSIGG